jgi:hypothetical protein
LPAEGIGLEQLDAAVTVKAPPLDVRDLAERVAELERDRDALRRDLGWFTAPAGPPPAGDRGGGLAEAGGVSGPYRDQQLLAALDAAGYVVVELNGRLATNCWFCSHAGRSDELTLELTPFGLCCRTPGCQADDGEVMERVLQVRGLLPEQDEPEAAAARSPDRTRARTR